MSMKLRSTCVVSAGVVNNQALIKQFANISVCIWMSYQFVIIHNNAPIYNCCFTYTWVNIRVYIIHLFNQHATDVKIRLSKYSSQIQSTNGLEIQVEENIRLTRALVLGGSNYCSTCFGFLIRKKLTPMIS